MKRSGLGILLVIVGCGGSDELITLGETCSRIAGPACDRAVVCGQGPASEKQACLKVFVDACCRDDGLCSDRATSKEADALLEKYIAACSAAFSTWDCVQYGMGKAPPQCTSVPSSPLLVTEPVSLPPRLLVSPETSRAIEIGRALRAGFSRR
jgi:hypothetical protein